MVNEPQFSTIGGSTLSGKQTLQQITHIFTSRVSLSSYTPGSDSYTSHDKRNKHNQNDSPGTDSKSASAKPPAKRVISQVPSVKKQSENDQSTSKALLLTDYLSRNVPTASPTKDTDTVISTPISNNLHTKASTSTVSLLSTTDEEADQAQQSAATQSFTVDSSNSSILSSVNIMNDRAMQQLLAGREIRTNHRLMSNPDINLSTSEECSDTESIKSYIGDTGHEYYGSVTPQDVCAYSGPRLVIDELIARGVPTELLPPQFDPCEEDGEIEDDLCSASAIFLPVSEGEDERINRV